jgi:hypothetical protein
MITKEKLKKVHTLCKCTSDFLKRSSGKNFRQLTIGKTGTQFSKEVIAVIHQTDMGLRKIWDHKITHIARMIAAKITTVKVKVPSKKKFFHDESLLDDFDLVDAYTITKEDADTLTTEIDETIEVMGAMLLQVIDRQQKVAYLLGHNKAALTLYNTEVPTSLKNLDENDLRILQAELDFQEEHLKKFMAKLQDKYHNLLYSDPGEPWPAYKTPQDLMENVENVDTTSIHQLDMYAIAAVEMAMMPGTIEPHKQNGVNGGIWHTMHDGTVCPDCVALDGTWMSWEEFNSIYKNTLCNGSCRCGELFEPSNNTTDPYSDTYGKEYYLDDKAYPKPCIGTVGTANISLFKMQKIDDVPAAPGSVGCALIQNAENSARKVYETLSSTRKKIADRFTVSPKVDFTQLSHFFTPSSAQFRTQVYRSLNKIRNKGISTLSKKINNIQLVSHKEFIDLGGQNNNAVFFTGENIIIDSELSPYALINDFVLLFNTLAK